MKLYHATTADRIESILQHGLQPRSHGHERAWGGGVDEAVFLTDRLHYAYAEMASGDSAIIEIDGDTLDRSRFVPDSDWLIDQRVERPQTLEAMTAYQPCWAHSLSQHGTMAYLGSIPPSAITAVVSYDCLPDSLSESLTELYASEEHDPRYDPIWAASAKRQGQLIWRWLAGEAVQASDIYAIEYPVPRFYGLADIAADLAMRDQLGIQWHKLSC